MELEEILKGMRHVENNHGGGITHYHGQGYSSVKVVRNSISVLKEAGLYTFTFKVYFESYEKWDKSGNYRTPYKSYTNTGSVSFTEENLLSSPGLNSISRLYRRLKMPVRDAYEWKLIMEYFYQTK